MKENIYITSNGTLYRHENTVYFEGTDENSGEFLKIAIPVQKIKSIYAYGRLTLSSGVIDYLAKLGIPIHYYNYYGFYEGSFYPRETLVSGHVVVHQAKHYLEEDLRKYLAKAFVTGGTKNILKNLKYYSKGNKAEFIDPYIKSIEEDIEKIHVVDTIPQIMNIEGRIRYNYYNAIDVFVPDEYEIVKRTRMPPENKMNTLISFGNSVLYTTILTEIYNTQANPTISFLHEPFARRFSLALDISEIFKPIIVDRVIFKIVNKNMLDDSCFNGNLGNIMLTDKGKKIFLREYDDKLKTTIKHRNLKRNVSYNTLIRLEIYKLIKHFLDEKEYDPLVMWW